MLKHLFFLFLISLGLSCHAQNGLPDEVLANVELRVENDIHPGVVIGIIDDDGSRYYSFGVKSLKTNEKVDEHSIFEIGSISKTFTGILLADMVIKGELTLEDPLQSLLPEGVTAPTRNEAQIKLVHMANHTSALPRMPDNFNPANPFNPYVDYTEKQLYDFLSGHSLRRDIGAQYEYSNYAMGLLGHVLAAKKNTSYEELMLAVIAKPLGMDNTGITLSEVMKKNLAMGHNGGVEVENWDLTTLAGAGAIRSSAVDMISFLAANMGKEESTLYPAMQLAHKNSREEDAEPRVGLGWHIRVKEGTEIIWHNGGTGGYRTFAGFVKDENKGVVVLTNSTVGADDIGFHLLDPTAPLNKIKPAIGAKIREVIDKEGIAEGIKVYNDLKKQPEDLYDFSENQLNSTGYYYLAKGEVKKAVAVFELNIEAYPNSSNVYDSYAEALLEDGNKEKAIENYKKSVEINPGNQNGIDKLKELGVDSNELIEEIAIDPEILESYVGKYALAPGFVLTVSREENQMSAQATGQGQFPIFPKTENTFYYKVVEAQLVFNKDEDGKVKSVTLFQAGQQLVGAKMDN
ncbi:MAG: serine hydrolase [Flavobacteriaceae bacterium]